MLIDRRQHLGWSEHHRDKAHLRALNRSLPLCAIDLPDPAPTSDNSALCCDLDQGALGSCTAQACAQVLYMLLVLLGLPTFIASRLAIYFWNRNKDGNASEDTGASVGGAFEVVAEMGVPEEVEWPYEVEHFAAKPGPGVDRNAMDRRGKVLTNYYPIALSGSALLTAIERVLTSGRGVAFGVAVTEEFCSTLPRGVVQAPGPLDKIAGGHALTIVGHNHAERWFLIKNSWGRDWHEPGQPPGCFRMSYDYVMQGSDFWFAAISSGGL